MLRAHASLADRAPHAVPGDAGHVRGGGGRSGPRGHRGRRGRDQARADRGRGRRARGRRLPARHPGEHRLHVRRAQAFLRRHLLPVPGGDAAAAVRPVRARRQRRRRRGPGRRGHRHRPEMAPAPPAGLRDRSAGTRRPRCLLGTGRHGLGGARPGGHSGGHRVIVTVTLNPALHVGYETEQVRLGGTNRVSRVSYRAGGRGLAVARVLHTFGHDVVAAGLAGGASGEMIRAELARAGDATPFTWITGESRRGAEMASERGAGEGGPGEGGPGGQNSAVTTFCEPAPYITTEELGRLAAAYRSLMADATAAVLSGSLPAGLPSETYGSLATYAAEAGVPVVLDAGGTALWQGVSRRPALVIPEPDDADPGALIAAGAGAVAARPGGS